MIRIIVLLMTLALLLMQPLSAAEAALKKCDLAAETAWEMESKGLEGCARAAVKKNWRSKELNACRQGVLDAVQCVKATAQNSTKVEGGCAGVKKSCRTKITKDCMLAFREDSYQATCKSGVGFALGAKGPRGGQKNNQKSDKKLTQALAAYQAKDWPRAFGLVVPLAKGGDAEAQFLLGKLHLYGRGTGKNQTEAAAWFRRAAEQGQPSAQYFLAKRYYFGQGVKKDFGQAAHWFAKAAAQGHARGQLNLGLLLWHGQGVAKDRTEALGWFKKSADNGHGQAQAIFASACLGGRGQKQDFGLALAYANKAAAQGEAGGYYVLGLINELGLGMAKNRIQAKVWYTKAMAKGHDKAAQRLEKLK